MNLKEEIITAICMFMMNEHDASLQGNLQNPITKQFVPGGVMIPAGTLINVDKLSDEILGVIQNG